MSAVIDDLPADTPTQRNRRRSAVFLRWLRTIHLYVGLWGAALGLLFGATGILLNHRAILKIPLERVVQKTAQLALPDPSLQRFDSADQMARWLRAELRLNGFQDRVKVDPAKPVVWADREVLQPARWSFNWQAPHKAVSAEYWVGNRFVKIETQDSTPLGTLMRLHSASGVSAFWVLLADTIAGSLMVLCLTGLLLWTRLRPIKLSAVAVSVSALLCSAWFLWNAM